MKLATCTEYGDSLRHNQELLQCQAAEGRYKPEQVEAAMIEYGQCFGMIDAMTDAERNEPFTTITGSRLHRIAIGAGVEDQAVIRLLLSLSQFQEQQARAAFFAIRSDGLTSC